MKYWKQILVFFTLVLSHHIGLSQNYSKARIMVEDQQYDDLMRLGLALDHVTYTLDYVEGDFSRYEIQKARQAGYDIKMVKRDAELAYATSTYFQEVTRRSQAECVETLRNFGIQSPSNFHLGSYKGNYTLEEMHAELDEMHAQYPHLISHRQDIGDFTTFENRTIQWLRISDNPDVDEEEPEILYTALHHAREPVSLTQLIYFMWYVLENYESNPAIKHLLENTELYFIPCVNPDGYKYNELIRPEGGGLWRKNRQLNSDGTIGVDLNRNYGHKWGIDNDGSSADPASEVYRGTAPFSEPETQAVRQFVLEHDFKVALNYHSYGGFLIYPWGYTTTPVEDIGIFRELGLLLTKENRYTYGTGVETVSYTTNGDADDWMYGAEEEKPRIFAMTPEIGIREHGFWPEKEDVEHLCQAALHQNIQAASFLLNSALVVDESEGYLTEKIGQVPIRLTKLGFEDVGLKLSVEPITDNITFSDPTKLYILSLFSRQRDHFEYVLAPDIQDGERIRFSYTIDNGSYARSDTIVTYYREPNFSLDNEGTLSDWKVGGLLNNWGPTTKHFYSPPNSLTDSPNGNYVPYSTNYLTLKDPIFLSGRDSAILTFKALWDIQLLFDFLQIEVSTDGVNFNSLCGRYSSAGIPQMVKGGPVYSGRQLDWISEQIDLSAYLGQEIHLRFAMTSTNNDSRDGFYIDDIKVLQYNQGSITSTSFLEADEFQSVIFPNPSLGQLYIETRTLQQDLRFKEVQVFNQFGQLVRSLPYASSLQVDVDKWMPGMYYLRYLSTDAQVSKGYKFMVR